MNYRPFLLTLIALCALLSTGVWVAAQEPAPQGANEPLAAMGTAFTYQGRLTDGGSPANGTYDFAFKLFDTVSAGNQVGSAVVQDDIVVGDGLFAVPLDFGSGAFNGDARYLEIGVRPGDSSDAYMTLSPRQPLTPAPYALALPALRVEPNAESPNLIGGHSANSVTRGVVGATIGGGGTSTPAPLTNHVTDDYGTVAGGQGNWAGDSDAETFDASHATVGGGFANRAGGILTTVGGGYANGASAEAATVAGGYGNGANATYATVGGGFGNQARASYATIAGGGPSTPFDTKTSNRVTDEYGTVGGGGNNQAGDGDEAKDDAPYATVGGGKENTASGDSTTIGGGVQNAVSNFAATVSGGGRNTAGGSLATIGGGEGNTASSLHTTIAGGAANTTSGESATVGGGSENTASGQWATIGGGEENQVNAGHATVGGGLRNTASFNYATIGGGYINTASADGATVAGGHVNTASASFATVAGGYVNTASAMAATVPGGYSNEAAGARSFAAGSSAKARHQGAFVWGDATGADIASTGDNQFIARASGGVWFYSNNSASTGVRLSAGSGAWASLSDRNAKVNFSPVDGREILARLATIPLSTWSYRDQDSSIRHIGPVAQDFYAAFGVGIDDGHISTVDADGVALAAIQGLHERSLALEAENTALRRQVTSLQRQNAGLEKRMAALERAIGANRGPAPSSSAGRLPGWFLFSGLTMVALVLGRHWQAGGRG